MGNANSASGGVRDRHKSGDSLPPSSPCGVMKDGHAFSFEKRASVGSGQSSSQPHYSSTPPPAPSSVPSSPAPSMSVPSSVNNNCHSAAKKIIQLQQSHDDDDPLPYNFPQQSKSKSILLKDLSAVIYFIFYICVVFLPNLMCSFRFCVHVC